MSEVWLELVGPGGQARGLLGLVLSHCCGAQCVFLLRILLSMLLLLEVRSPPDPISKFKLIFPSS